jgi:hypothetical protein
LFEFRTETEILQEWFKLKAINQLFGFENNRQDGKGMAFNFILSNGLRSKQRENNYSTEHTFMIPKDAI